MTPCAQEPRTWPIIVGGCYRCGTTLLRHLLNGHSRIHCGPELSFLREVVVGFEADPYGHLRFVQSARAYVSDAQLLEIMGHAAVSIHRQAAQQAGKPRWADKHPINVFHLPLWERLLGSDWHWVHVVRNPVDAVSSMIEIGFPLTLPPSLDEKIDCWRRMLDAGEAWRAEHPGRSHRVNYEELVREPDRVLRELMSALGESFEPTQLVYCADRDLLEDPKSREHSAPHANSIGRGYTHLTPGEVRHIVERTAAHCERHAIHTPPPP